MAVTPVAFLEFLSTATGTGVISRGGRYDGFHYASSAANSVLRIHSDRFWFLALAASLIFLQILQQAI
jgi:hypothetical protein